jgi:hypothetical protein
MLNLSPSSTGAAVKNDEIKFWLTFVLLYQKSPKKVFRIYAGIVIKIPKIKTLIISLLGSLNLSELTKNNMISIEGKIVTNNKDISFSLLLF